MLPTSQPSPRVHDLLLLRPGAVISAGVETPPWVDSSSNDHRWVVVRRAIAKDGFVAVGIRGIERHQRWGGFVDLADVRERVRPSQLASHRPCPTRAAIPAFGALVMLEKQLTNCGLDWGPVGSVGFELATGEQAVSITSDLDLALFAPIPFARSAARDLWNVISAAPAKVDVCVETPCCGFSLEEFAREGTERFLVRLPANRQLAADPWTVSAMEV